MHENDRCAVQLTATRDRWGQQPHHGSCPGLTDTQGVKQYRGCHLSEFASGNTSCTFRRLERQETHVHSSSTQALDSCQRKEPMRAAGDTPDGHRRRREARSENGPGSVMGRCRPVSHLAGQVEAFSSDPRVGVLAQRKTLVGFPALQQRRRPAAHIWLGRRYGGTSVLVLVHDLHIRVLSTSGRLLRDLTLDPSRDYQPQART